MSFFANQKLAVRLGVAFGALALGLLVVAAIAWAEWARPAVTTTQDLNHQDDP